MTGNFINLQVEVADTLWRRFRGWIGRTAISDHEVLLIPRCHRVHTFFMRLPIDVVYLDKASKVVAVIEALQPWRIAPYMPGTEDCLELKAGRARQLGIRSGVGIKCEAGGDSRT